MRIFNKHNPSHSKDILCLDCVTFKDWKSHKSRSEDARKLHNDHAEASKTTGDIAYYSIDLQKVIMLPWLEMFKTAILTRLLTTYNKCFVPFGSSANMQK